MLSLFSIATIALSEPQRVAIVGSGVSGSAAAFYLSQSDPSLQIDVYEAESRVGGRAHTLSPAEFGVPLDAGATSIFSRNEHLVDIVNRFKLAKATDDRRMTLAIWDGNSFRFKWPDGHILVRILLRYGLWPLPLFASISNKIDRLGKVYIDQQNGKSWPSPAEMLDDLGLSALTQVSAREHFRQSLWTSSKFIDEFVDGASRANYNQDASINAFVDMVSLAGAGIGGEVFSLANGTTQIAEALVRSSSNIRVRLRSPVRKIEARAGSDQHYIHVRHSKLESGGALEVRKYDAVVVATPLENAKGLELIGAPASLNQSRPYQTTYVTFTSGDVDPAYFGLPSGTEVPNEILTTQNVSLPFSSCSADQTLPNGTNIWKLFSKNELSEDLLDTIFLRRYRTRRLHWPAAYTKLLPTSLDTWPSFEISLNTKSGPSVRPLIYTSALESAVSTMETQIVSGKNAALRIIAQLRAQH